MQQPAHAAKSSALVIAGLGIVISFAAAAILIALPRSDEKPRPYTPAPATDPLSSANSASASTSTGTRTTPVSNPPIAPKPPAPLPPPSPPVPVSTTVSLTLKVASMNDTAEEKVGSGAVDIKSTDLELVHEREAQVVGIRFGQATIPPGATIREAYIQFTVDETKNMNPAELIFAGEATDNAALFATDSRNVSSRPCTTAQVTWKPPDWTVDNEAGPNQRTPELRSILQEIVNRPGWASGNSLAFIVRGSGRRVAKSYVNNEQGGPVLHVTYSTPPGRRTQQ